MPDHESTRSGPLRVVVAGGGTGGHLYPGIAVARAIQRRVPGAIVTFAGTARGLEARVVPREGFELDLLRSAGLKGKSFASRLSGVGLLAPSLVDASRIILRRSPRIVIGVGGYSSGPVVGLAALGGIPTMVLEQNAVPGLTNRLLSRVVSAAAVTYEDTLRFFRGRGFVAGNPVRAEFFEHVDAPGAAPGRVLILGGSQGAHAINMAVVAAAAELVRRHPGLQVVHQTGDRDLAGVRAGYRDAGVDARAESFFDPVVGEMRAADLVVCRAGATTLAELCAVGRAAVLAPFAAATDDHQRKNATVLAEAGGAVLLDEGDLDGPRVAAVVGDLLADRPRLARMAAVMHGFARPDAADAIVDRALALARWTAPAAGRNG